ncbi:hypothetical protein [Nocardia wallacei]|uniref:Uncharacterized protein n=1 Tax=Nocardia wallacei TaxID=480035 RepID=A0A7G1KQY7_9NOCA|nr:hypothetical protein [Nocardia wallacei]BCK56986.1 hypothetical protein NWFMUON74_47580 [Nocardia wallacei]
MNFEAYLDRPVTLFGIAQNSMTGAVLLCGSRSVVYIEGVREWSDTDVSKTFEVSGTLVAAGDDADLYSPEGAIKHGIGRHYVVKDATVERLS